MTPEQFARVGRALHGPSWRRPLADDLDVRERTIYRMEKGETPIREGVVRDLAALCRAHSLALAEIARELDPAAGQ